MLAFARGIFRLFALGIWTAAVISSTVCLQFRGWKGRQKISERLRVWCAGVARICRIKIHTAGDPYKTDGGIVVSNHMGYVDIVVHGTVFPLRFAPSTEVMAMPVAGWIVARTQPVVVNRRSSTSAKKALRDFCKTVKKGLYLIVYPEGTSTDGQNGLLKFKTTPFEPCLMYDLPVVPVITRYKEIPGMVSPCWINDMELLPHLWQMLKRPSIEVELYFLDPVYPEGRNRKELAEYVRGLMDAEVRRLVRETGGKEGRISIDPVTGMVEQR